MKGKMGNESGNWIMYGVSRENPECIHAVDEAVEYINKVGFLPLFKMRFRVFTGRAHCSGILVEQRSQKRSLGMA